MRSGADRYNYVRVDGEVSLEGTPKLPEEFKRFWDLPRIQSQIISIAKTPPRKGDNDVQRKLTCTINKGNADNVFIGMSMYAGDEGTSWIFTVIAVDEKSATLETTLRSQSKALRVGQNVSSSP